MSETSPTSQPAECSETAEVAAHGDMTIDQIDYVADLISELRVMSKRARLETLATLLALAQAEAARISATRRSPA